MTKATTAVLFAGPKYTGSFSDTQDWRIGLYCQVVDGGSNGPFLLCNMQGEPERAISWQGLSAESGIEAVLMALALYYGDRHVQGLLQDTHNVEIREGKLYPAPFYELAPEVAEQLADRLRNSVKLGALTLAPDSSMNKEMIEQLEALGFLVNRFASHDETV